VEDRYCDRVNTRFVGLFSVYAGDHSEHLFQTLWSILRNQTVKLDDAIGVVEGNVGSELQAVIAHFNEVHWLYVPKVASSLNFGLPACLNAGLQLTSDHDVVLKIDTDDIYVHDRVEVTRRFFNENPDLILFGGQVLEWDSEFQKTVGLRSVPEGHQEILKFGRRRNPFNGPTVAFRAERVKRLGGFRQVGANEDYVLWAELLQHGVLALNSTEVLAHMRGGDDLVFRRSNARTRKGEYEALKAIYDVGFFTKGQFLLHAVTKSLVRRLPFKLNGIIYRYVLRTPNLEVGLPDEVRQAAKAIIDWNATNGEA
jgi:glycosyltransferase involved in cell wall biosynthesis